MFSRDQLQTYKGSVLQGESGAFSLGIQIEYALRSL